MSFADAGELWIEVGAAGESDLLSILGALDLSGSNDVLHLQSLNGAFDGSSYLIATFAPGTLNEQRFDQILLDGVTVGSSELLGNGYRINYDDGLGRLTLVAVPEPAGGVLLVIGWTTCLLRRRKQPVHA